MADDPAPDATDRGAEGRHGVVDGSADRPLPDLSGVPIATVPYYWHTGRNEPVLLYRGPFTLRGADAVAGRFRGQVIFDWLPIPRVRYAGVGDLTPSQALFPFSPEPGELEIPGLDQSVPSSSPWKPLRRVAHRVGTVTTSHYVTRRIVGRSGLAAQRLTFGVANFLPLFGDSIRNNELMWPGRVVFGNAEWRVVMDARVHLREAVSDLNENGGYLLTHGASVERTSGEPISLDAAEQILDALTYFLWFARSAACGPVLPVGLDADGSPLWAMWDARRLRSWSTPWEWLDESTPMALQLLFPGFMRRWNDPYWQQVIRIAVRYYHEANAPDPLELATTVAHVVLDSLAFSVLVDGAGQITAEGYEARSAGDNVRDMLDHLGIDATIPAPYAALEGLFTDGKPVHGPRAVARLRNDLMHLRRSRPQRSNEQKIQGWTLAVWYLELALLRLFEYSGPYRNRLRSEPMIGATELVPWAGGATPPVT